MATVPATGCLVNLMRRNYLQFLMHAGRADAQRQLADGLTRLPQPEEAQHAQEAKEGRECGRRRRAASR